MTKSLRNTGVMVDEVREAIANEIYMQLCHEIRDMGMIELISAKKAWSERKPFREAPATLQARVRRVAEAALAVKG